MRQFIARYTLRTGESGQLFLLTTSSCSAILMALEIFGDAMRTCSARPG